MKTRRLLAMGALSALLLAVMAISPMPASAAPTPALTLAGYSFFHKYVENPISLGGWMQAGRALTSHPVSTNEFDYGYNHNVTYGWQVFRREITWNSPAQENPCTMKWYQDGVLQGTDANYYANCGIDFCPQAIAERANFSNINQGGPLGCGGSSGDTYNRKTLVAHLLDIDNAFPGAMYLVRLNVYVTFSTRLCPLASDWSYSTTVPGTAVTVAGQIVGNDNTVDVWVADDGTLNVTPSCSSSTYPWIRWTMYAQIIKEDL